jgi:hypothetical protein
LGRRNFLGDTGQRLTRQFFGGNLKITRTVRGPGFCFTYENARKIARTMRGKKSELCVKVAVSLSGDVP